MDIFWGNGKKIDVFFALLTCFVVCLFFAAGCSTSDDEDEFANGGLQGGFTSSNMFEAADVAGEMISFAPTVGLIMLETVEVIGDLAGGPGPLAAPSLSISALDLGDIGLCFNGGTSTLNWEDADNSTILSPGDTATLSLTNCDLDGDLEAPATSNGLATFAFIAVDLLTSMIVDITYDITTAELVDGVTENWGETASFRLEIMPTGPNSYSFLFGGVERQDLVSSWIDGQLYSQFGCFDIVMEIIESAPDSYTMQPRGIANIEGSIMQMGSYFLPDPALIFGTVSGFSNPLPISGQLTLLSFDGRPSFGLGSCTAVGSFGTVTSDNSWMSLKAIGDGITTLELYDGNDTLLESFNILWELLM